MGSTFHLQNFGCRAEQADGAAVARELERRGWQYSSAGEAEVVVLNTCTVTAAADADARAAIRRIHRANPEAKILVTGCYAQRAPQELARMQGVEWVVGNSHKHLIGELLGRDVEQQCGRLGDFVALSQVQQAPNPEGAHSALLVGDIFAHTELLAAPVFDVAIGRVGEEHARTRPNLKVQDGCNNRCSFCVIPSVRGRSRSLAPEEVLREVRVLVEAGYREVVISGINLGRWGRERGLRLPQLVRAIVEQTDLEKLRISSVEPMDWSDELIELVAGHPRIARHAHIPLQSGSDRVLRRMHRKYRPWHYAQRIEKIRAAAPLAAIGADVMTGFPGESAEMFEESRSFIEALPFTYLHVFTFSARPGTEAAAMPEQVPVEVARERNRILRGLAARKNREFRQSLAGKELEAITLLRCSYGCTEALTTNYLKFALRGEHPANRWMRVRVDAVTPDGLRGCVISG